MSIEESRKYSSWLQSIKNNNSSSFISQILLNFKEWEDNRKDELYKYCNEISKNEIISSNNNLKIHVIGEKLGTLEGSGCAIINILKNYLLNKDNNNKGTLALLAAGEGSRLWGISASNGFIKALTYVFKSTLLDQTINQCAYILSQTSEIKQNLVLIAGTDNILLPSIPLQSVSGILFNEYNNINHGNMFFFSKEITVLDNNQNIINESNISFLEQLGIMIVDSNTSYPIEFREKIPKNDILQLLYQYKKTSVFFNAFIFGCTPLACKTLVDLYSINIKNSNDKCIYECKDFDWSKHFIEPISLLNSSNSKSDILKLWEQRWTKKQQSIFSKDDWFVLLNCAEQFINKCGSPIVINLGSNALWIDTGLSSDLYRLYNMTLSTSKTEQEIVRNLFSLSQDNYQNNNILDNTIDNSNLKISNNSLVINSQFKKGGFINNNSIIVNSIFNEYITIPEGIIIINSSFNILNFNDNISSSMIYSYKSNINNDILTISYNESVYFSIHTKTNNIISGCFPLYVNPKTKSLKEIYYNHYNKDSQKDKIYLEQQILNTNYSFRELQQYKIPSFNASNYSL